MQEIVEAGQLLNRAQSAYHRNRSLIRKEMDMISKGKKNCHSITSRCLIYVIALLFAGATGTSVKAASSESRVIGLGSQPYPGEASIFVAESKGFFGKAGVVVNDRRLPSGRLTLDAMLSGAIDIATPVETGPMFAIANGKELAIIAQISTNQEEVKPVVRLDSGIRGPKDLAGKRLGYGAGSSNQFAMYNWLKAGGVPASAVKLVNLQPPDLVTALVDGQIDVAFTWEPFLSNAVKKGEGRIKVVDGQRLYQSRLLLVARPKWVGENTEPISRFLKGLMMAADWIRVNRSESVKITADAIGMDPKDLDPIFDRWQFEIELSKELLDAFNEQFEWAAGAKLLPAGTSRPNFRDYFYPASLKIVRPDGVTH
jgi:NitT/TauT family transport system substrate-binding protein